MLNLGSLHFWGMITMPGELERDITNFLQAYYSGDRYKNVDLKNIKIDQENRDITIDVGVDAVGYVIGRKGTNIKEANREIVNKFGKQWRIEIESHGKVSGSGQRGRGKQNKRSIIKTKELPLTVPFSSLQVDNIVTDLTHPFE